MDDAFEKKLMDKIEPIYKKGRDGDWDHILRVVQLCRYLLEHENGDEDLVLPAAYLHDLGWTAIDFSDFKKADPKVKSDSQSFSLHMVQGAVLAGKILSELDYEIGKTQQIQEIIKIHDLPEKVFAMDNISATLVVEADRLDRYGKTGMERFKTMFGKDKIYGPYWEEAKQLRRDGLKEWFKTNTGVRLSQELAAEMGLFDD
ncbi:MAG: HD domain-containing protein [Desulfobacteraceae bacterium]|nr:HD domain-containing protein [Desulfobacteraceae bacterium]